MSLKMSFLFPWIYLKIKFQQISKMFWWLRTVFVASAIIYLFTLLVGLLGNTWVIASLFRTGKKASFASGKSLNPSDRLRKYIWLLSLLDLFVSGSLALRIWVLLLSDQRLSDSACRWVFAMDQTLKMCSLTCLACISIERFITIRKPFNNKIRKVVVRLTPLFALFTMLFCGGAILWMCAHFVGSTDDGLNCTQRDFEDSSNGAEAAKASIGKVTARLSLAVGFCVQLGVIESNYVRIVLHVKRKFWQRKARAVANCISATNCVAGKCPRHSNCAPSIFVPGGASPQQCACARLIKRASPPPQFVQQTEPRYPHYMRDMNTTIRRIAVFHLVCWLPYCLLSLLPANYPAFHADLRDLQKRAVFAVRIVDNQQHNWAAWAAFVANWLTYCNSAGNWVLYAALNRDLRSIIKASSERRKRSTMSHQQANGGGIGQPSFASGMRKRSVRRGALQSLRLFYSLNSHRSSADSVDADFTEAHSVATTVGPPPHNGSRLPSAPPNGSPRSPRISLRAPSVASGDGRGSLAGAGGTLGRRDGRAHSYCGPATPPSGEDPPLLGRSASPSPKEQRSFGTLFEYQQTEKQIRIFVEANGRKTPKT